MLLLFVLSHVSAVFVVDTGKACFVWIGQKASIDERRKGLQYAHVSGSRYLLI